MFKLIWSAFALSLILFQSGICSEKMIEEEFLGLEAEITPELKGSHRFTPTDLHQDKSWRVHPNEAIVDTSEPNKGQGHSIIPWDSLGPEEWLSFDNWMVERKIKDSNHHWKIGLRQINHSELMGKVLQCKGVCSVYRGNGQASVQHLSRILEGDELKTEKDSLAWVYLIDGTLIRISPESSVTFNEVNVSKKEFFHLIRLNHGHVFWHPRSGKEFNVNFSPETDSFSLPLLVREANRQNFERSIYQNQNDLQRVIEYVNFEENATRDQFLSLNKKVLENNAQMNFTTKVMLVAPNSSIISSGVSFDFIYLNGGKSFFKRRETEGDFKLSLRGYIAEDLKTVSEPLWYEVASNGRSFSEASDNQGTLQILELLTKRIQTIELAREIWVNSLTIPLVNSISEPQKLAREFGHYLWGNESEKRFNFLLEYTRRIETTNLRSLENLMVKSEEKGDSLRGELSDQYFTKSLNNYLLGLKSRYDNTRLKVREMNDLQYYVWILKNGKF